MCSLDPQDITESVHFIQQHTRKLHIYISDCRLHQEYCGIMASVSTAAFAFMLIVAMAVAYPVHKVKVTNQDHIKAIKDRYLRPLQNEQVLYFWRGEPAATKKGFAMMDEGEDGKIVYAYGSKKYQNNDYAMRDNGYGKVKNQDLINAIKDGDLQPLQGQIKYYWVTPSIKKSSAMRDDGEGGNEDNVYGSKKYRNNDFAMRDNGNGKPRNIMG